MKYRVFLHNIQIDDNIIKTYGIIAEDENGKTVRRIFDVSTDCSAVKTLAEKINRGNLEPIHLDDVLEDFYTEHC